jgi:transposase
MDQVHVIRHQVLVEGRSRRQVAKEFGISRLTVRKYVGETVPSRKVSAPRARPVWEAVQARVETLLGESAQWTGGKQRLTATRLHGLLVAEGHTVGVTVVKAAVAEWKRQRREVFVPLTYRPGDLAEVDFFEVLVDLDGTRRKAWLFLMRLCTRAATSPGSTSARIKSVFSTGTSAPLRISRVCRLAWRTTICGPPLCGSSSAARGP